MSVDLVRAARELCPRIIELRDETESERRLAEPVVEAVREAHFGNLMIEAELGGLGADPLVALALFEELAAAEASVAWIVWNSALPVLFGQYLDTGTRRELFGDPAHLYASSTRPTGRAAAGDDGYRVSGRWSLVSGCMHADSFAFMCVEEEDGETLQGPGDAPVMRLVFVPKDTCDIIDTWHVGGLRGTGSHDVVLDDAHVPTERTCSPFVDRRVDLPIGRVPIPATMSAGHAALGLGVATAALEDVLELARSKVSPGPAPGLRDRTVNQRAVAGWDATLAGARARLYDVVGRMWSAAEAGTTIPEALLAEAWGAAVTTAMESRAAVADLYAVAGTSALYVDFPLERRLRDIQAMMQHVVVQPLWLEQAGAVKMGLPPTNPLFAV